MNAMPPCAPCIPFPNNCLILYPLNHQRQWLPATTETIVDIKSPLCSILQWTTSYFKMLHCFLFCFCIFAKCIWKIRQIQICLIYKNPLHVRNSATSWDSKTPHCSLTVTLLWICHFNSFSKSPMCLLQRSVKVGCL